LQLSAPAKLNLCLYLGRPREDGLHELCSLFEPLALADLIKVSEAERDEVVCPGVEGENLAARALAKLRERGWERPPLRVEIEKRVPVAAGLGGGSADAAAVLRLARGGVGGLQAIAAELGADVPSQLVPALSLVQGAGERVEPLPRPVGHAALLLPDGGGLSTAEVFAAADRLGLGREAGELAALAERHRVARDLNESVAASVAGVLEAARAARAVLASAEDGTGAETGPDDAARAESAAPLLAALQADTQAALAQMRGLIAELRPKGA
jgi:4-diphosphocytidyl-2-C-methyl-D-erythritol kinase